MKYGIIAVAWIAYLIIGIIGIHDDSNKNEERQLSEPVVVDSTQEEETEKEEDGIEDTDPVKENETQIEESQTDNITEAVTHSSSYAEDSVINRFITEFNDAYSDDIHDISKGNIRTKYFGYVRNSRLEMINANDGVAKAFRISIYGGNEEADRDAMFSAFREIIKILESSLTDEAVSEAIEDLIAGDVLVENYPVGTTLSVTYVPIKELSYGKNDCRLDILASNYDEISS